MTAEHELVRLQAGGLDAACQVLADALFQDAVAAYLLPDEAERARWLPTTFRSEIRYLHQLGEIYTTAGSPTAIAAWATPTTPEMTPESMAQAGLTEQGPTLPPEVSARAQPFFGYMEDIHAKDAPEAHWYLSLLGVIPACQGTGLGGALVQLMLKRIQPTGLPAYLWTGMARNVGFYQRQGFRLLRAEVEPVSQLSYWTLRYDP